MQIMNQFSYVMTAGVIGLVIIGVIQLIPRFNRWIRLGVIAIYTAVVVMVGLQFQYPDSPTEIETLADVEAVLINEKSTFVMLYSNY